MRDMAIAVLIVAVGVLIFSVLDRNAQIKALQDRGCTTLVMERQE